MTFDSTLQPVTDAAEWDAVCLKHRAHLLQTHAWGELKEQFGWRAERMALRSEDKIQMGAQILYRALAPGLTVAYIPRGPFGVHAGNPATLFDLFARQARARGAFLLKLEPDWHRDDGRAGLLRTAYAQNSTETIQPPATIHLDLTPDLDTILARMKPKWRYNIRLSGKKGVVVRAGTPADLPAFYELMRITGARDHFAIHGADYYGAAFTLLAARNHARLFIAEYERQPLAMIFVTAFADQAIYLYGASGNTERNRMPNHALHWAAIEWAKARGCTRYDLWGVPETVAEDTKADLPTTLFQFKYGFGGEIVRYTGAWDIVFSATRYQLYKLARRVRKSGMG